MSATAQADVVAAVRRVAAIVDGPLRQEDYQRHRLPDEPTATEAHQLFVGWSAVLDAAGLRDRSAVRRWTDDEALQAVADWIDATGGGLAEYRRATAGGRGDLPSEHQVRRLFGGWKQLKAAVASRSASAT